MRSFLSSPWQTSLALVLCGFLVYLPGLEGDYIFDDIQNIVENTALRPESLSLTSLVAAALSSESGPLRRPLASLSFLLNFELFGTGPYSFKAVNLAIHLVNGLLLFAFLRRLVPRLLPRTPRADNIAGFTALAWTLHPFNLTGVLYIVQRMTSLSATFSLLAALLYVEMRSRAVANPRRVSAGFWLGILVCGTLAVGAKENAALLPFFLILIEVTAFGFVGAATLRIGSIALTSIAVLGAYYLIVVREHYAFAFRGLPFTQTERLLTEFRILAFYARQILVPNPGEMALLHSDWVISRSFWQPWTTGLCAILWGGLVTAAMVTIKRYPAFSFALGWFLIGHLLESTVLPLDLVYEHRNYLPSIGPLMLVGWAIAHLTAAAPAAGRLLSMGLLLVLTAMTAHRAWQWSDSFTLAFAEARHNPSSARARYEYARQTYRLYLVDKKPELLARTRTELRASIDYGREDFHPLVAMINSYVMNREPVPESLMVEYEQELRTGRPTLRKLDSIYIAIKCQMTKACPPNPPVIFRALSAAFDNPALMVERKARMLEWLALYYSNTLGDLPAARRVIEDAVRLLPGNFQYRLRLLEVAAAERDWTVVRRELESLQPRVTPWFRSTEPALASRFDKAAESFAKKRD